jgi:hypothetical protein
MTPGCYQQVITECPRMVTKSDSHWIAANGCTIGEIPDEPAVELRLNHSLVIVSGRMAAPGAARGTFARTGA